MAGVFGFARSESEPGIIGARIGQRAGLKTRGYVAQAHQSECFERLSRDATNAECHTLLLNSKRLMVISRPPRVHEVRHGEYL